MARSARLALAYTLRRETRAGSGLTSSLRTRRRLQSKTSCRQRNGRRTLPVRRPLQQQMSKCRRRTECTRSTGRQRRRSQRRSLSTRPVRRGSSSAPTPLRTECSMLSLREGLGSAGWPCCMACRPAYGSSGQKSLLWPGQADEPAQIPGCTCTSSLSRHLAPWQRHSCRGRMSTRPRPAPQTCQAGCMTCTTTSSRPRMC